MSAIALHARPAAVLLLGDPRLRAVARPVDDFDDPAFIDDRERLHATLAAFRQQHGFGRAIAAPQIGVPYRFIAADLGEGPFTLINPLIVWRSEETFTLWDDCMSFPSLLVRVRRHSSISLRYRDELGNLREWTRLERAASELFQHEIDHLDGILAVDRAIDRESLVLRDLFAAAPERFRALVD
jgi:peptide deformylase